MVSQLIPPPPKLRTISESNEETIEGYQGYEIKQILPTTRDIVTGNSFKYNGMNINITSNSNDPASINKLYDALIEFTDKDSSSFVTYKSRTKLPHDFIIDFEMFVDNIGQISFCPLMVEANNKIGSCSVKNYQIFCSDNGINYKLIKEDIFDSSINNLSLLYIFEPAYITFEPISTRFIKLRILSIYNDYKILNTNDERSGFANFRIYTNTKNLYIKESDQSISNYKDNSFNQVTTKLEWDQKSKEDKIILNKQASFDNPSISKIKNELNDFRIITNHNNIPIYEKT